MTMIIRAVCFFGLLSSTLLAATDSVRQVQEELRKRNLFFGDIDGQETAQLSGALKRYQARKGFDVTGVIDAPTAASLQIRSAPVASEPQSDSATVASVSNNREPSTATQLVSEAPPVAVAQDIPATEAATETEAAAEQLASNRTGAGWADLPVAPEPPAEAPEPPVELTPERVNRFVETYLADGETDDIGLQAWFYSFPVKYFEHGLVDQDFVVRDTQAYVKRWPARKYRIVGPISFARGAKEGQTAIEFTIDYTVQTKSRVKSGRTKNFWTVRSEGEDMKIIAIREEHISG